MAPARAGCIANRADYPYATIMSSTAFASLGPHGSSDVEPLLLFTALHANEPASSLQSIAQPLAGGVVLGVGAALLLASVGRIAGVSGILGGLLPPPRSDRYVEAGFRVAFLAGLLVVGLVAQLIEPTTIANDAPRSLWVITIAGLAVGFGTRLGNGCTSGHGVCGVSRLAPRSIVATVTFIATAVLTFWMTKNVGGGS